MADKTTAERLDQLETRIHTVSELQRAQLQTLGTVQGDIFALEGTIAFCEEMLAIGFILWVVYRVIKSYANEE